MPNPLPGIEFGSGLPKRAVEEPLVWQNVATSLCLDGSLDGFASTLGCNDGEFQRWDVVQSDFGVSLRHERTGLCLDVNPFMWLNILAICNDESTGQKRTYTWDDRGMEFRNVATGDCLDSNADGRLYALGCNGGD